MHAWAHKPTANRFLCNNVELFIKKKKKSKCMWWPDSYLIPALGSADIKVFREATDVSVLGAPSDL